MERDSGPGNIDWLTLWHTMYHAERDQAERATGPDFARSADCWAERSVQFAAAAQRVPQPDSFMRFVIPHLRRGDTVLDIGAGTGRYATVLSQAVRRVIAVEPSESMRSQLEQRITSEELDNVEVVATAWPEADVPECDIIISSHVLYGVGDIGPFLQQMDARARRSCFLLLALRHPSSFISAFWERFYGESRHPLPGAMECFNALYQLGIAANLTLIPLPSRFRYANEQEALADIRWRLRFALDAERDARIQDAMAELLECDSNGRLGPRDQAAHAAIIWWSRPSDETDITATMNINVPQSG